MATTGETKEHGLLKRQPSNSINITFVELLHYSPTIKYPVLLLLIRMIFVRKCVGSRITFTPPSGSVMFRWDLQFPLHRNR